MKILAIRGSNLASLAGEFAIDFTSDPLASTGLFAISGPTGAGKSTLLDALCLALYDDTPRLKQAKSTGVFLQDVGEHTLTQSDTRNLLRRGSSEGFAEVDFIGSDKNHYRARWSVRRAKGKNDGKLQNTEMHFCQISHAIADGKEKPEALQPIGGKKTEVLQEIEQRIGLSFEQFTRAVLLAQNEFSTFLKAKDDERAGLLETLTGTNVYSQISKQAYRRAKLENEELVRLEQQLSHGAPLDDEARQQVEQRRNELVQRQIETRAALTNTTAALAWFETLTQLIGEEQRANQEHERALTEQITAARRREQQALWDAVEPARPLVTELDRLKAELANQHEQEADATTALTQATNALNHAKIECEQAKVTLDAATKQQAETEPTLRQARELDSSIAALLEPRDRAEQVWKEHRLINEATKTRLQETSLQARKLQQELEQVQTWLKENQHLAPLHSQWQRWAQLFKDASALQKSIETDQQVLAAQRQKHAELTSQQIKNDTDFKNIEQQQVDAKKTLAELEHVSGSLDLNALAAQRDAASQRKEQLSQALQTWSKMQERRQALLSDENDASKLRIELKTVQEALTRLNQEIDQRSEQLRLARNAFEAAQIASAENVIELRDNLKDGAACPVCGSLDHPYAHPNAGVERILLKLKTEVEQHEQLYQEALREIASSNTTISSNQKQLAKLEQTLSDHHKLLAQLQMAWESGTLFAELTQLPEGERSQQIQAQYDQSNINLIDLKEQEALLLQRFKAIDTANQKITTLRVQLENITVTRNDTDSALKLCAAGQVHIQKLIQSHQLDLGRVQDQLDAAYANSDWKDAWTSDPTGFVEQQEHLVQTWSDQQTRQQQTVQEHETLTNSINSLTTRIHEQERQLQSDHIQLQELDSTLQHQQTARRALLAGEPADIIQQRLSQTVEDCRTKLAQQQTEQANWRNALTGAETTLKHIKNTIEKLTHECELAATVLHAWLATYAQQAPFQSDLSTDDLRQLLAIDKDIRSTERKALEDIDKRVHATHTVWNERQSKRDNHQKLNAPTGEASEWQEQHQTLTAQFNTYETDLAEAAYELRNDDERKIKAATIMEHINAQKDRSRLWGQLNELIGSADGKKFRNYAQQLTLDILLGYANRHLLELARRYRLARIPDTLALQVIDQDMGDEIRSVHSLSGGESFLASLALALGLASLSSNRVQVESLFIDEGFGSLDSDTLRIAMEALDCLQSQGRKVGVITHVQEMTERIDVKILVERTQSGKSMVAISR